MVLYAAMVSHECCSPNALDPAVGRPRSVAARRLGRLTVFCAALLSFCAICLCGAAGPALAQGGQGGQAGQGENLLVNAGAGLGAVSAAGWDSVTIPGWRVASGLPTVVKYGTAGFPKLAGTAPALPGGRLFAGGAGGSARLSQRVSLRMANGRPAPARAGYRLSAQLGQTATSRASVVVRFFSSSGRPLGRRAIGPAGARPASGPGRIVRRTGSGVLPRGAASAQVTMLLSTSLTNIDGPDAPAVGYDRAVATDVDFAVAAPVAPPPALKPPAVRVPRFDHVFLFYFENQDYRAIIGNRRNAPYLNSLRSQGSTLSNLFAEEHPSDGNYLALAGGSTFGLPLTDPLEENPRYTVNAPNIGDLVDAGHETWKAYLQSAAGPCDDTVHGYYWNDDLPLLYFSDVRERSAYCAAHLTPLESLSGDLSSTATTPNFAWIGADDCSDMEGCGVRAGDRFLARELNRILRSPAWRTQRSLAIITFDEDDYDHERPAQRVPTLILGSAAVRRGYVSRVRYTHYSLLRTIEAALGLGTLTQNDRYANATNDVFDPGSQAAGAASQSAARAARAASTAPARRQPPTALVVNSASATVTPVSLTTREAGRPIPVGSDPEAIALGPAGRTAYVVNSGSDSVTPIDTATRRAGRPIPVGSDPGAIALGPAGRTAYVVNGGSDSVTPIDTATGRAGRPIPVGSDPRAIALDPVTRTAYVLNWGGASVTPIDTETNRAGLPIPVGAFPSAIAIAADGATAYVANYGSDTVTPISTATGAPGRAIAVGAAPDALAVTPDGKTVEVVNGDTDDVTPIATSSLRAGHPIKVGYSPEMAALSRSGATAYVVNTISGTLTPIATRTGSAGRPISVGLYSYPLTMALAPTGPTAVVVDNYAGRVTPIDTRTRHVYRSIKVGSFPVAVAITR